MTKRSILILLLASIILLPGCFSVPIQHAYFPSPLNGIANDYHPIPLVRDSAHTAVYAQGAFLAGTANSKNRDDISAFRTSLTVAHHSKHFQAYYGGNLTLGNYHMGLWDSGYAGSSTPKYNADILNSHSGPHFFGGAGFHGGANFVIAGRDAEWRVLGIETSLNHEFGDYLSLRRQLPDSAATLLVRKSFFGTLGLSSELVGVTANGEFGFRLSVGRVLGNPYWNPHIFDFESLTPLRYWYSTFSFHYTQGRYTGFGQLNSGSKAFAFSLGLAYRLSRPRNAPLKPLHRSKPKPLPASL